jgi:hypothetical protein
MKQSTHQLRQARLQKECDVSAAPAILLLAACSALVMVLGLNGLLDHPAVQPLALLAPTSK